MRTLLAWICIIGIGVGPCTAQQGAKQTRRRFDPPSVVTTTEAVYPLQSVASGTVVLEVSLDDAAKITDIHVVRAIASLTEPRSALCGSGRFKRQSSMESRGPQGWPSRSFRPMLVPEYDSLVWGRHFG